jgi:hypothetical protein
VVIVIAGSDMIRLIKKHLRLIVVVFVNTSLEPDLNLCITEKKDNSETVPKCRDEYGTCQFGIKKCWFKHDEQQTINANDNTENLNENNEDVIENYLILWNNVRSE